MSNGKNELNDRTSIGCEDISPIVVDLGSHNCKFGHNQEDSPRIFFESRCGEYTNFENNVNDINNMHKQKKLLFPLYISNRYENVKIKPLFYRDNLSNAVYLNNDVFETMMEVSIEGVTPSRVYECKDDVLQNPIKVGGMNLNFEEHPILLSDFNNHNNNTRKEMTEILFEKYNVPALFFAKKAKLTAYSVGRTTGLVIDIGACSLNINPVYEGYVLQKNSREYNVGGNYLDSLIYEQFVKENINMNMLPAFCKFNASNEDMFRNVHNSYISEGIYDFIRYFKSSVCKVRVESDGDSVQENMASELNNTFHSNNNNNINNNNNNNKYRTNNINSCSSISSSSSSCSNSCSSSNNGSSSCCNSSRHNSEGKYKAEKENSNAAISIRVNETEKKKIFDLPDGSVINIENYEYDIAENFFKNMCFDKYEYKGLLTSIKDCVLSNDVDIRKDLLQSVILTGGSSLFQGFPERLYSMLREEDSFSQVAKLKVINLSSVVENLYSPWIGGSILASLGTFQQIWISRKQYMEKGHQFINDRCY